MSDDNSGCGIMTGISFVVLVFIVGVMVGNVIFSSWWQDEAVKHHAAEYYLDTKHNRQWRWLDTKKEQKP